LKAAICRRWLRFVARPSHCIAPTVAYLRRGRDTVLEAALAALR
jgi:hypothetical protein